MDLTSWLVAVMVQHWGGWEVGGQLTLKLNSMVKVHAAANNPLPYVITNISILAIFQLMLSFIHSFVTIRTGFQHADGGLVLHPAS
jgi:hypothetical protein